MVFVNLGVPLVLYLSHSILPFSITMQIDKNTKYDRQIRLWATTGQSRLEKSHVCVIGATATGSEILKNLVLPGIGTFTIIDSAIVAEDDLSGNFFLQDDDLGSEIAPAMCKSLLDLNSDVNGHAVTQPISDLLGAPDFWDQFAAVVLTKRLDPQVYLGLKQKLWEKNVPLLSVATAGFYGILHIISRETTIVETHDPSKVFDLRIDCPWPELQEYADSFVLEELDSTEHAHVPYIVIFIKALQRWKADHNDLPPQNYAEKKEFRSAYVESMARNLATETNFLEASQSIHRALQVTRIPEAVKQLFNAPELQTLSSSTSLFWLFVAALKEFVAKNDNKLPLPGNLPDMTSKTSNYIRLQNIYRKKAAVDQQAFSVALSGIFHQVGLHEKDLNQDMIASFCKNSAFLYVSKGSLLQYSEPLLNELRSLCEKECENNTLAIYFGILALHDLLDHGAINDFDSYVQHFSQLFLLSSSISLGVLNILKELFVHYTTNYHNICSLMGGIGSQEVLKIVTQQYIPLDNLYVFDGVKSISDKWKI